MKIRLGWYARLVIVLAVAWTLAVGFIWYLDLLDINSGYSRFEFAACVENGVSLQGIEAGDREACRSYSKPSETAFEMWFYSTIAAGIYAAFGVFLATIGYWAVKWILGGSKSSTSEAENGE